MSFTSVPCPPGATAKFDSGGVPSAEEVHSLYAAMNVSAGGAQGLGGATSPLFSQAAIVNGLTDFVVNRAKDELAVSFLLDLRDRMKDDDLLSALFAQTLVVANDLEARSVKQLLPPFRSAMTSDLRQLPARLVSDTVVRAALRAAIKLWAGSARNEVEPALRLIEVGALTCRSQEAITQLCQHAMDARVDLVRVQLAYRSFSEHRRELEVLVTALRGLGDGEAPLAVLSRFADLKGEEIRDARTRAALLTLGMLAREYRLSPDEMRDVMRDAFRRELLLALIARDLVAAQGSDAAGAAAVAAWATRTFRDLQTRVTQLAVTIEELTRAADALRNAAATARTTSGVTAAGTVTNAVLQVVSVVRPLLDSDAAQWDAMQARFEHLQRLQAAIADRRYVTAVTELNLLFGTQLSKMLSPVQMRTLTFVATIAEAETSEQVAAAIEAAAVPVTSFRAKRTWTPGDYRGTFGLNAYVGFSGGHEQAFGKGAKGSGSGYAGLAVPVGIEWSLPLARGCFSSLSLFVPILDLGTIASFRLGDDSTVDNTPSVTFAQVIAPGAYAAVGITKRMPLSLVVGAQYVPGLRKATADGRVMNAVRIGAMFAVDVPVFRF